MWHLATSGSMDEIAEYIQGFGPMAMVVSMLLDIFVNAVGFLPSIFISTANGLVFGMWPGIIISWLAETIGVVISFYIMRYFLRDTADKLIAKSTVLMKVDDFPVKMVLWSCYLPDPYHIFRLVLSQHLAPSVKSNRETIS